MSKAPWWKSQFIDPTITEIMFGWRTNAQAEVNAVIQRAKLKPGAHVLDLACGQGRHALAFALRGFRVTGLDYSPLLLARAKQNARVLPKSYRPNFIQADMRSLKTTLPKEGFDAVVSLWNSWGYFDKRSDDLKTLKGIAHVLKPGGKLILNTLNEGGVHQRMLEDRPRWHEESKGRYFLQKHHYERPERRMFASWILIDPRKASVKKYFFTQNVYSPQDFKRALKPLKMKVTALWGLLEGTPYTPTAWHQTFVAQKALK